MRQLDLDSLEVFLTVVQEGGVAKAAAKLHRVQSNISTRIKQLEERLNVRLFLRHKRQLLLSPEGEILVAYAEQLLNLAEEAENRLQDQQPKGVFRIGTMESTAAARLPAVLSRYHAAFPQVDITVKTDTTDALITQLLEGTIEAAFVAEPVEHPSLETLPAFDEELILLSSNAALATNPDAISQTTIIAFRAGCAYRRYLERWLKHIEAMPQSVIEVSSYHAIVACVCAGTGIAIVPKSVINTLPACNNLHIAQLPATSADVTTLLAWRRAYVSPKLNALKKILNQYDSNR